LRRRFGQRFPDHGLDGIRDRRETERRHRIERVTGHDFLGGPTGEGRVAGKHLVQHAAQTVDIAATVQRSLTYELFRAHVDRCADRQAGIGQRFAAPTFGSGNRFSDAEVGDEGVGLGQQDVSRLDVAVDDTLAMGMVQRISHLSCDLHRVNGRKFSFSGQPVAERFTGDIRHHIEQEAFDLAGIMERQDVRVLQDG
jgi:hypothetical protein